MVRKTFHVPKTRSQKIHLIFKYWQIFVCNSFNLLKVLLISSKMFMIFFFLIWGFFPLSKINFRTKAPHCAAAAHIGCNQPKIGRKCQKGYLPHASPKPPLLWQPLILPNYEVWNPIRPSSCSRSGRTCCISPRVRKQPHMTSNVQQLWIKNN